MEVLKTRVCGRCGRMQMDGINAIGACMGCGAITLELEVWMRAMSERRKHKQQEDNGNGETNEKESGDKGGNEKGDKAEGEGAAGV